MRSPHVRVLSRSRPCLLLQYLSDLLLVRELFCASARDSRISNREVPQPMIQVNLLTNSCTTEPVARRKFKLPSHLHHLRHHPSLVHRPAADAALYEYSYEYEYSIRNMQQKYGTAEVRHSYEYGTVTRVRYEAGIPKYGLEHVLYSTQK